MWLRKKGCLRACNLNRNMHTRRIIRITCSTLKARYTLFVNNSKIRAKRRKNDVQRIVYKRRSPCFANWFFAVRCTQDLRRGSGLIDEHKEHFRQKKSSAALKLTANSEQCTATRSSRFRQQYFIRRKNNFVPYSSCLRIVYSRHNEYE